MLYGGRSEDTEKSGSMQCMPRSFQATTRVVPAEIEARLERVGLEFEHALEGLHGLVEAPRALQHVADAQVEARLRIVDPQSLAEQPRGLGQVTLVAADPRELGQGSGRVRVHRQRPLHEVEREVALALRRSPLLKPWSESTNTAVVSRSICSRTRPTSSS